LAPFYSHTGSPYIDPELMLRMLFSGTALAPGTSGDCEEVQLNLAYRWLCRPDLEDVARATSPERACAFQSVLVLSIFQVQNLARSSLEALEGQSCLPDSACFVVVRYSHSSPRAQWPAMDTFKGDRQAPIEF
jgi:hypothetical protein